MNNEGTRFYAKIRRDGFSNQPIDIDVWREITNEKGKVIENRIYANAEQFDRRQKQLDKIYEIEDLEDRMGKLAEYNFLAFGDYPRETFKTLRVQMYDAYLSLSNKEKQNISLKAHQVGIISKDQEDETQTWTHHPVYKDLNIMPIELI